MKRFHRRLETEKSVTVPGWTLETAQEGHPLPLSEILAQSGERNLVNRATPQRAK